MTNSRYQLVKAADSRKWHWFEQDADECFCGNVKSFATAERVDPESFGEREISQICKQKFRTATQEGRRDD